MAQSSKGAFKVNANEENYRQWQQWQQQQNSQTAGAESAPVGNERAPGLRNTPVDTVPIGDHFERATNQESYNFAQQNFKAEPMAAPATQQKTTDDQPGAYPDGNPKEKYPNLPLSTDKGRVMDLDFPVTGSDGQTHMRSAKVYVPNEVADKMQENQAAGRDALDGVNIMMGFHGHGGSAENTLDGMDMADIANKRGAILVSPQGLGEENPDAPADPKDNPSHWDLKGSNDPEFIKNLLPAASDSVSREYGVNARMEGKEVDLVGMSQGANSVREIAANPEKYLPDGTKIGTVASVTASGDVIRDANTPANVGGTQLYIFGMQDEKAADKILGDENSRKAYLDSLSTKEKRDFHSAEDKTAYAIEHRGENDKLGELMKDDYMGTVQAAAAAQGVMLSCEDIEKTRQDIYKPILDDKGNAVLGADGKPTYDTNTVLGSRYNIDVEQDGHKFKAEVNISNNMDHNWTHDGPSRMPGAIKDALKNDDGLEARYRDSLSDDQRKEYNGLSKKDKLEYAVNNQGERDPETGRSMLEDAVRKKEIEKYGIDPVERATEIMKKDDEAKNGPSNDRTLDQNNQPANTAQTPDPSANVAQNTTAQGMQDDWGGKAQHAHHNKGPGPG